jgi:type I restriction enzyme S subunit
MADKWQRRTIGELCDAGLAELQTGPFGSQLHAYDYTEVGVPVVPTEAIRNRQIDHSVLPKISIEKARALGRHRVRSGDILFARRGAQATGHIGYVRAAEDGFVCGTGAIRLRINEKSGEVDGDFLSHVLANPASVDWFKHHAIGATMPNLNEGIIRSFPITLPPTDEQRAIASVLSTLDDKIELNRRTNETLKAVAQALFKSWFVDFDPVRAKTEGRSSKLPQQFQDFFPASFESSELGVTPEGWRIASIGDLCRRVAMGPFGSDIKTDNFVEAGVPIVRGSNLTDGFVENAFAFLSEEKADELRNANAFPGDIVITHRGTLGQVGLIPQNSRFPRYVVSQSQMLLAVDQGISTSRYIFDFLRSPIGQHALLANTSQTGVPAIARPTTSVKAIRLVAPPMQALKTFDQLVSPIYVRRDSNIAESRTLTALRDTLLPKLISGELRVKVAEKIVEAVA